MEKRCKVSVIILNSSKITPPKFQLNDVKYFNLLFSTRCEPLGVVAQEAFPAA